MYESLHNHTKASDGTQNYLEVLKTGEKAGFGVLAFTDHDALPSVKDLAVLRTHEGPVKWLAGIEISAGLPKELGDDHPAVHVLGLFVDPTDHALLLHCEALAESRILRAKHFVGHLSGLGFQLTLEECLRMAEGQSVGSPHIVKALERHEANRGLMDRMEDELRTKAKTDPAADKLYKQLLADGPKERPYVLFMKEWSYVPMPRGDFGKALADFDASVKLIRDAGGVALLAHWFYDKDKLPLDMLEKLLKEKRLDGLEAAQVNSISQRDTRADSDVLVGLVKQYDVLSEVGVDAHSAGDFAAFLKSYAAEMSVGQTRRLIERVKPDLGWSNLG